MSETIAAIATAQAPGGIGVVRISGPEALAVADRIFCAASGARLAQTPGYRAHFGHVKDEEGEFDEAVALVFRAPKSYTGEDVAELSCHGGVYLAQRLLRAAVASGARLAGPGEFTRRAFLNGKMGLTQAEAVMDLIGAQGEAAARAALSAHEGALARRIGGVRSQLVDAAAHLTAWADFPDEEVPEVTAGELEQRLCGACDTLSELLRQFDAGRAIREGVETVILGRPNVGKSTLMNLLSGCERSIVTDVAGTTRDVVEETVRLGDVLLRLADTAGLRETDDPVEKIGVDRAKKKLSTAGLVLAVFDGSQPLAEEDRRLLDAVADRPAVAVINKEDLSLQIDPAEIGRRIPQTVTISAAQQSGLDALTEAIAQVLGTAQLSPDEGMLFTERQREAALRAQSFAAEALSAVRSGITFDAVTVLVESAIDALLELTGEKTSEAVVDAVFAQFCVGK